MQSPWSSLLSITISLKFSIQEAVSLHFLLGILKHFGHGYSFKGCFMARRMCFLWSPALQMGDKKCPVCKAWVLFSVSERRWGNSSKATNFFLAGQLIPDLHTHLTWTPLIISFRVIWKEWRILAFQGQVKNSKKASEERSEGFLQRCWPEL